MASYDRALICANGHLINSAAESNPGRNSEFCPKCGKATLDACRHCQEPIRGDEYDGRSETWTRTPTKIGFRHIPSHCHACGKPYPWTERKAEAMEEMIDELDDLSDEERARLKQSIPDIIADTPRSETAALRFKKAATQVGQTAGNLMMSVLTKVATETVKQALGL